MLLEFALIPCPTRYFDVAWVAARRLVAGDDEGVLSVWEWKGDGTLEQVTTLAEHDDMVSSVDVVSTSYDNCAVHTRTVRMVVYETVCRLLYLPCWT